jgi:hypothetical protein
VPGTVVTTIVSGNWLPAMRSSSDLGAGGGPGKIAVAAVLQGPETTIQLPPHY